MEGTMRGDDEIQDGAFSYLSQEQRIPQDHPPRPSDSERPCRNRVGL